MTLTSLYVTLFDVLYGVCTTSLYVTLFDVLYGVCSSSSSSGNILFQFDLQIRIARNKLNKISQPTLGITIYIEYKTIR